MNTITEMPDPNRELLASLEVMARSWKLIGDYADEIATHRKRMFDAYTAQGFSEDQALKLVRGFEL